MSEEDRQSAERANTFKYMAIALACFAVSLFAGMAQFQHKWIPSVELGLRTPEFQELNLPRGHFGFILSDSHDKMPQNATVRLEHLVDCDAPDTPAFQPPCYPGLHKFVIYIWVFTLLCPVFPVLVAMLQILFEHRHDNAEPKTRFLGCCQNKEGWRGGRFLTYLSAVVFLQVWTICKRIYQGSRPSFDPSDTICVFFGCGAIMMREVSHIVTSKITVGGKLVVVAVVFIIIIAQLYYVYFTAMYFHLPSEVFAGGTIGVFFSCIFVLLTTKPWAMRNIFTSSVARRHHADGTVEEVLLA